MKKFCSSGHFAVSLSILTHPYEKILFFWTFCCIIVHSYTYIRSSLNR